MLGGYHKINRKEHGKMNYLITGAVSLTVGLLSFMVQQLYKDNKRLRENRKQANTTKESAIKEAICCLLRVQLIEYHDKYMELGEIPSYAYQNWTMMYEAYHDLGGNGMITKMDEEIKKLPIK